MKCARFLVSLMAISTLTCLNAVPLGSTTTRSTPQFGDSIKQLTNQLMEANATSEDIITLDTRTPPKIKQYAKKKTKVPTEHLENSHAGVAIPVDEDEVMMEETTKKLNFYKIEKPTTNSGLSTWILLSGQTTQKPSRKPVIRPNENQNTTLMVEPNKVIKPLFKKRGTTTTTPSSATVSTTASTTTKLNKVKAAILNNAKKSTTSATTVITTTSPSTVASNSSILPMEAKEVETELNSEKKTRRPSTTKRKKNKNKRRRPSDKVDTVSTSIEKPTKTKEKPIGTQLYNYLSREIMPTVGVGLVGLMVTAGLASYFLYPFGVARRSYDIDRRDKDHYYYTDDYSGGIAEEEAIGKVIAGMPSNSLHSGNSYKSPTSRNSFSHRRRVVEQENEVTPAAVPEHGPRRMRKRRQAVPLNIDTLENEIDGTIGTTTTKEVTTTTEESSTNLAPNKSSSLLDMFKEIIHFKIELGLKFLQRASEAVSKYVSDVQRRLDKYDEVHQNTTQRAH